MHISFKSCQLTFNGLLTIIFVMLKLQGAINWAWPWVLSPIWIPVALGASVFLGFFLAYLGACLFTTRKRYI